MLVLDSGALTRLAERPRRTAALLSQLQREGAWPARVPTVVVVESVVGRPGRDANVNRFLQSCDVVTSVPLTLARRAATLRSKARRGSAVDALVVAYAEPGGTVLTGDGADLRALAAHALDVDVVAL